MYVTKLASFGTTEQILGAAVNKYSFRFFRTRVPGIWGGFLSRYTIYKRQTTPLIFSQLIKSPWTGPVGRSGFLSFPENDNWRFKQPFNKGGLKLGISASIISMLVYIFFLFKEDKEGCSKPGQSPNLATKYILSIINDPRIEESLRKLFKKILIGLVKDEDFSKDWRSSIRSIVKQCENDIGQSVTDVLKTKIVQDWLYSTTNEIVEYISRTPEIISKISVLFSDAVNHQIFTENSKKWLEEFIQNCIINNKKVIQSINQLLAGIFNTKEIQGNLSNIFKDVILNENTQDYISLAFWNVIRKSMIFPKNWFNGTKRGGGQIHQEGE
ncbi:hypothetical protein HWI79_1924 [Cryptosporidium felis]|nr:hypothetical protein HWI79_1924 [Cryptosporidium felis]